MGVVADVDPFVGVIRVLVAGDSEFCRDGVAGDAVWRFPWRAFEGDGPEWPRAAFVKLVGGVLVSVVTDAPRWTGRRFGVSARATAARGGGVGGSGIHACLLVGSSSQESAGDGTKSSAWGD